VTRITTISGRPADARLESWTKRAWQGGVQIDAMRDLDRIAIRTRNSSYELIVLDASRGEVMVRGGRYFPEYARATLLGCSLGGAFLKLRGVYPGFCMELYAAGMRVVTTAVQSAAVAAGSDAAATLQ
jgi:hypothetical protein